MCGLNEQFSVFNMMCCECVNLGWGNCLIWLSQIRKKQNLMREGGKKHLRKQNNKPIFGKVIKGVQVKKNIGQISWNVDEGDEIKKLLPFFKKGNEGDGKKSKQKHSW